MDHQCTGHGSGFGADSELCTDRFSDILDNRGHDIHRHFGNHILRKNSHQIVDEP